MSQADAPGKMQSRPSHPPGIWPLHWAADWVRMVNLAKIPGPNSRHERFAVGTIRMAFMLAVQRAAGDR